MGVGTFSARLCDQPNSLKDLPTAPGPLLLTTRAGAAPIGGNFEEIQGRQPSTRPRGPFPGHEIPQHSALAACGPEGWALLRRLWEPRGSPAESEAPWACGVRTREPSGPPGRRCVPRSWAGRGLCPAFTSPPFSSPHWPLGSLQPLCSRGGLRGELPTATAPPHTQGSASTKQAPGDRVDLLVKLLICGKWLRVDEPVLELGLGAGQTVPQRLGLRAEQCALGPASRATSLGPELGHLSRAL